MKRIKFDYIFYIIIVLLLLILAATARAQQDGNPSPDIAASGGNFTLEKAVIAGGGNQSSDFALNLGGTSGQSVAGVKSTGGSFSLYSGFWTSEDFAPTAASVVVGGQVKTADGRGIRNALITITFPNGQTQVSSSGSFGYYRFANIPAGNTYSFTVSAKQFHFNQSMQIRTILDDTQDINFVAAIEKPKP